MPRKKSPSLTDAEFRLMEVVWQKGAATVGDVVEALPAELDLAYSTVLTTLRILEDKGYLRHTKQGRAFVYEPLVDRDEASRSALRQVLTKFFGNSREQLVLNLLQDEDVTERELARLKKLIGENEK